MSIGVLDPQITRTGTASTTSDHTWAGGEIPSEFVGIGLLLTNSPTVNHVEITSGLFGHIRFDYAQARHYTTMYMSNSGQDNEIVLFTPWDLRGSLNPDGSPLVETMGLAGVTQILINETSGVSAATITPFFLISTRSLIGGLLYQTQSANVAANGTGIVQIPTRPTRAVILGGSNLAGVRAFATPSLLVDKARDDVYDVLSDFESNDSGAGGTEEIYVDFDRSKTLKELPVNPIVQVDAEATAYTDDVTAVQLISY